MLELVGEALKHRVGQGIATGTMSDQAAGASAGCSTGSPPPDAPPSRFELAGAAGAAWTDDDGAHGRRSATTSSCARSACIGGGTTEMARNVISERVLGMPRERTLDRDVAFRDVPRSASPS